MHKARGKPPHFMLALSHIFNGNETGIPLNPKSAKVDEKFGAKSPSYLKGISKALITVLRKGTEVLAYLAILSQPESI